MVNELSLWDFTMVKVGFSYIYVHCDHAPTLNKVYIQVLKFVRMQHNLANHKSLTKDLVFNSTIWMY